MDIHDCETFFAFSVTFLACLVCLREVILLRSPTTE